MRAHPYIEMEKPRKTSKKGSEKIKWLHVYGDLYSIGMLNIGYQLIWDLLLKHPNIFVDRIFYGIKKSLQEDMNPDEFDVISFTIPYESVFLNVLKMLDKWDIEKNNKEREFPIIIFGGFAPTYNPAVYSSIADIIFVGDDLRAIDNLFRVLEENWSDEKKKLLTKVGKLKGVFSSALYSAEGFQEPPKPEDSKLPKIVEGAFAEKLSYSLDFVTSPNYLEGYKNYALLEISRGCPHRCLFCALSHVYKPLFREKEEILSELKKIRKVTDKVRFVSSSETEHKDFKDIVKTAKEKMKFSEIRIGSQRADALIKNPESVRYITYNTITLAPETGENLRFALGKKIPDSVFIKAAKICAKSGKNISLFTIVNFPLEREIHVHQLKNLLKEIYQVSESYGVELRVYVNNFMPMPRTPLQYEKLASYDEFLQKSALLEGPWELLRMDEWQVAVIGPLERGDYLLSKIISEEKRTEKVLRESFEKYRGPYSTQKPLSWEVATVGLPKKYLIERRKMYYEKMGNL